MKSHRTVSKKRKIIIGAALAAAAAGGLFIGAPAFADNAQPQPVSAGGSSVEDALNNAAGLCKEQGAVEGAYLSSELYPDGQGVTVTVGCRLP